MARRLRQRWQWLSSKQAKLYLCYYVDFEKPISRHYVSGFSQCKSLGLIERVENILSIEHLSQLEKHGEIIITNIDIIEKIIEKTTEDNREVIELLYSYQYVYLVVKKA